MDNIKRLLRQGKLAEANADLTELIRSPEVVHCTLQTITGDVDFWRDVLARHEFRIVPDGTDMEQIIEPRYVNVVTESFFIDKINDLDDVVRYSIHGGAHYKCEQMWKNCPVPMNTFNEHYLAWLEDIYGQRFVHQTASYWHRDMYITANYYFEFHGKQPTKFQQDVINMLQLSQPISVPALARIHEWLYEQDALQQVTFDQYMRLWSTLRDAHPTFKQVLDQAFMI
jgi:hypothetical protein